MNANTDPVSAPSVVFDQGTHRTRRPEDTLADIGPKLAACGITRVADVTRLDRVGIPTCCAIRPASPVMQVTNGKGATKAAAQVSALMEAIELFHAERPHGCQSEPRSEREMRAAHRLVPHRALPSFRTDVHHDEEVRLTWLEGRHMGDGSPAWIPADAVFLDTNPAVHAPTTNGLASGNHPLEASLHALYELIERDAGARLSVDGKIELTRRAVVVDPQSIDDEPSAELVRRLGTRSRLVICHVEAVVAVSTFWVIALNEAALSPMTAISVGWGTHARREIALARAMTEAAQSRLTYIHGAREDIVTKASYRGGSVRESAAWRFFERLEANARWADLPRHEQGAPDLEREWARLLRGLEAAGFPDVYRFDLTREEIGIPVVRIVVPGLLFNPRMF